MSIEIKYEIKGLYPEERDYIVKQLELIKDKLFNNMEIKFSLLKSSLNMINVNCDIEGDESALKLFQLLSIIKVPKINTCYEKEIPVSQRAIPSMRLFVVKNVEFKDFNKG